MIVFASAELWKSMQILFKFYSLFISLPEEWSLNSIANNLWEETDHFINISSSESCCEKCNELKNEVVIPNWEEIKEKREKDHIQKFLK